MGAAVVLQARMGSARLPGKVLATIGHRSLLEHCIARLSQSGLPVIVATTTLAADDAVEARAAALGAAVHRGDEHDVLARYCGAARVFALARVVRATADNPFVDAGAVARTLALLDQLEADHVVEGGLPAGAAVEAVTVEALERASRLSADPYDREHVTSFIRRDARFTAVRAMAPGGLRRPGLRLTVDTADDLAQARRLHAELDGDMLAPLADVIFAADALAAAERRPIRSVKQGA